MAKGVCAGGDLDVDAFLTPIPWIGLYIAAATSVCFFFMTTDFYQGCFYKKPFFPCKWFRMNALTLTLLQVATKIPVDLVASMPRADDQLSKLTGTTLLCISLGFYMPSLGTMETVERYSNMLALSVMVITAIVCVCIQMHTGPIFAFIPEHIIIIVFMFVLLCLMWSSAIAFRGQIESSESHYRSKMRECTSNVNNVDELKKLLKKVHVLYYTGNPQTLLCETSHHNAYGLLCVLSALVVIEATLRTFIFKSTVPYCHGADDYKWSILFVIVTQLATIAVGTLCIIFRWCSFVRHTEGDVQSTDKNDDDHFYKRELEYLKLKTLSFKFFGGKYFSQLLQGSTWLLIRAQILLFGFSKFIGYLTYGLKKILGVPYSCVAQTLCVQYVHRGSGQPTIYGRNMLVKEGKEKERREREMSGQDPVHTSVRAQSIPTQMDDEELQGNYDGRNSSDDEEFEGEDYVISSVGTSTIFKVWIRRMALNDWKRWRKTYKVSSGTPENRIPLLSERHASNSESDVFDVSELEGLGINFSKSFEFGFKYDQYKVSCLTVLVLSGILKNLMPSSHKEFLDKISKTLEESFEIIYYVDQKALGNQTRLTLTKNVWDIRNNTENWFHEIISDACNRGRRSSGASNSDLDQDHASKVLMYIRDLYLDKNYVNGLENENKDGPLGRRHKLLTLMEFSILCKFILSKKQELESIDIFAFLKACFVKVLRFTISRLPLAILKEIKGDYPDEICEENVREALKFFCILEPLENDIDWSSQPESLPGNHDNGFDPGSDFEAKDASSNVDGRVGNTAPVCLADWLCGRSDWRV